MWAGGKTEKTFNWAFCEISLHIKRADVSVVVSVVYAIFVCCETERRDSMKPVWGNSLWVALKSFAVKRRVPRHSIGIFPQFFRRNHAKYFLSRARERFFRDLHAKATRWGDVDQWIISRRISRRAAEKQLSDEKEIFQNTHIRPRTAIQRSFSAVRDTNTVTDADVYTCSNNISLYNIISKSGTHEGKVSSQEESAQPRS